MSDTPNIRPTIAADLAGLSAVVDATGMFPGEILPEMAAGYLASDTPAEC